MRSGESTRLPPMWLRFDSRTRRLMWVEFVVGSRPCSERFFSGYSGFPPSAKTIISKFQFDLECTVTFERAPRDIFGALWVNNNNNNKIFLPLFSVHSYLSSQFFRSSFRQHHSYSWLYLDDALQAVFVFLPRQEPTAECLENFHSSAQCDVFWV